MSLENLARMGRIRPYTPEKEEIQKLLEGAARCLRDANNDSVSNAGRFTFSYTAIMEASQAALFANGYRPNTNEGGHHATMVQALVHTIGLDASRMQVLDAHRRKRHVIEYSGEDAEPAEVQDAIDAARALLRDVKAWLKKNRPELA
jgi:uncharacterized protein (UPF0332 family)